MNNKSAIAGEWLKLAPFRILSVDIECAGRKVCYIRRFIKSRIMLLQPYKAPKYLTVR